MQGKIGFQGVKFNQDLEHQKSWGKMHRGQIHKSGDEMITRNFESMDVREILME